MVTRAQNVYKIKIGKAKLLIYAICAKNTNPFDHTGVRQIKFWPTIPIKWQSRLWFICPWPGDVGIPRTQPQMLSLVSLRTQMSYMEHNKWASKTLDRNGNGSMGFLCPVSSQMQMTDKFARLYSDMQTERIYALFMYIYMYMCDRRPNWPQISTQFMHKMWSGRGDTADPIAGSFIL